ncbi:S-layer homology domain-containing protein [Bacillus sp. B190/17]|uniref:S-layer homology domain-containing protein n=1 Tax=Bacillus lumedeiriae TaxID=3058829 RepID=A0ABW8ICL9_9BACI
MKSFLLKAGVLTCLATGIFHNEASAESDWASKCSRFGELQPNKNPSFQHINCLLTNAALEANIPPEVAKAVAAQESGWKQFDDQGKAIISADGGIGLMQITNQPTYEEEKLKTDIHYNIETGMDILSNMYARTGTELPVIKDAQRETIENWYFPVMAYNGIKPVNSPVYQHNGQKNTNAYQEKVFTLIEQNSFLNDTKLASFPFQPSDFNYDPESDKNIVFLTKEYTLTDPVHHSAYFFKNEDQVIVTKDGVNVRTQPNTTTSKVVTKLSKNTNLIITGPFTYDQTSNHAFVWYPVKTTDGKTIGYMSSAYISKKEHTASFIDVSKEHRFYNDIHFLSERGIISGFEDGSFQPNKTVTRAEAAIMISRALELPINSTKTPFTDVSPSSKAAGYIAAAYKQGIISGFPNETFQPAQTVSRGQMAIFLARAFELQEKAEITFPDVAEKMASYEAIQKILAAGITQGYEDGRFQPDKGLTRGDFSALLARALRHAE